MFSLSKLSYFACSEADKSWYDTQLSSHRIKIDLELCCKKLLRNAKYIRRYRSQINICRTAAQNGHLDCLMYARKLRFKWNRYTCESAASFGHLDILKYAHKHGCPWDVNTCRHAAENEEFDIIKYVLQDGCP